MASRTFFASTIAGVGLALATAIPAAQATAPVHRGTQASAHATQALNALNARWNAEAAAYRAAQTRQAEARAVNALDLRLTAQAKAYDAKLTTARIIRALDARWNAQATFFGLR